MNAVRHQLKWDFRRLRTPWIFWLLLLALAAFGANLTHLTGNAARALTPLLTIVQYITVYLFGLILVGRLMYSTPFTGANVFWKTRPLTRRSLFLTKSILILAMIWLPVMVAQFIGWSASAPGGRFLFWATLNFGALTLAIFLFAAVWAALCERVNSFIVCFVGTGAWAALCGIIFARLSMESSIFPLQTIALSGRIDHSAAGASTAVIAMFILAIWALVAWFIGGRAKSPRSSLAAVGAIAFGVALATTGGNLWKVNLFNRQTELPETELPVTVLASDQDPAPGTHLLWNRLAVEVPKGHYAAVRSASFLLDLENPNVRTSFSTSDDGPETTASQNETLASYYPEQTEIISSDLQTHNALDSHIREGTGKIEGAVKFYLVEWRKVASLPLRSGARTKRSDLGVAHLAGMEERQQNLELRIGSILPPVAFRDAHPLLSHRYYSEPVAYVVHVPESKRAVVGRSHGSSTSRGTNISMESHTESVSFPLRHLFGPGVNERDLSEARLDIYTQIPVATAHSPFKRENWVVYTDPARDARRAEVPRPPVAAIAKLPANATEEQVDAYLETLLFGRVEATNWRQIEEKLLAIGPENLDRLLRQLPVGDHIKDRVFRVVEKLATDDHRSILAEALEDDPALAHLFLRRGWEESAVPALAKRIRRHIPMTRGATASAVRILARQHDPSLHDDLRWHFVHASSGHREMASALETCPEFPLDEAIAEVWNRARFELGGRRDQIAALAARLGDKEALRIAFLAHNDRPSKGDLELLSHAVDHPADDKLPAWIHANFEALRFDKERKKFVLR